MNIAHEKLDLSVYILQQKDDNATQDEYKGLKEDATRQVKRYLWAFNSLPTIGMTLEISDKLLFINGVFVNTDEWKVAIYMYVGGVSETTFFESIKQQSQAA